MSLPGPAADAHSRETPLGEYDEFVRGHGPLVRAWCVVRISAQHMRHGVACPGTG